MGNPDELREAYRQLIAAVAANDEDALRRVLSTDVVDRNASPDQPPGLTGIVSWMRGIHAGLSGFTGSVEDTVVEGEKVAGRVTWRGTHTGPFLGLAPTNKQVQITSMHFLRFKGGLGVEWWGVPDLFGAVIQLGGRIDLQKSHSVVGYGITQARRRSPRRVLLSQRVHKQGAALITGHLQGTSARVHSELGGKSSPTWRIPGLS